MAVAAADAVYEAAVTLLAACSDALTYEAPAGPIDYQAVWPGLPSYDCVPQLAVHVGGSAVADTYPLQPPLQPMQRIAAGMMVDIVQFTITVLRCVPVPEQNGQNLLLPDPADISAAARATMGDLWAIWNHLKNEHRSSRNLFQNASGTREFAFQPAVPVRTSGGAGGWEIPVTIQIPGYPDPGLTP